MLSEKVLKYIDEHSKETYDLLLTIAKIPAPSNHEEKRMEFCRDWLISNGAKGVYTDEALNVVYPYGVTEDNPVVVFMAHIDVVFPDTDELPLYIENGRINCPGIGDDTANLAALLMTAKYVAQNNPETKDCGVVFVCNAGEEGMGNLKGSRKICETYKGRIKEFYSFDGTMEGLLTGAVGSARYKVTVKTEGGHSYANFGNQNAIAHLSEIVSDIYKIDVPKMGKTSYNVGTINGGTSVNTIAQEATMLCEYRSDDERSLAVMKENFEKIFENHRSDKVKVDVELVGLRPCESMDESGRRRKEELVLMATELLERTIGRPVHSGPASTDCNIPLSQGIPAVCYGTYFGAGAHTREEYVKIDSLPMGYKVAFESVLRYFK